MAEKTDGARAPSTNDIPVVLTSALDTAMSLGYEVDNVLLAQLLIELREIKAYVKAGSIAHALDLGRSLADKLGREERCTCGHTARLHGSLGQRPCLADSCPCRFWRCNEGADR